MSARGHVDLNADVGEGCGFDEDLMGFVSSANIACGAHAGDMDTMRRTLELALVAGVAVGAHPGFKDREHFGRKERAVTPAEAASLVREQAGLLSEVAGQMGARVGHLKLHGALYNMAARDRDLAEAVCGAALDAGLALMALSGSVLASTARSRGLRVLSEAFADRAYLPDGSLAPRSVPGAFIADPEAAALQALGLATTQSVKAVGGAPIRVEVDTICLHGDSPASVALARRIRALLAERGVDVRRY